MVKDAEANAAEDERRKDNVETKNNAESLLYQTQKQLKDLGDKVPADLKAIIDPKVAALKSAIESPETDMQVLKKMCKDLQEELMKVGQAAYASTGDVPGDAAPPPPSSGVEPGDVIDVD